MLSWYVRKKGGMECLSKIRTVLFITWRHNLVRRLTFPQWRTLNRTTMLRGRSETVEENGIVLKKVIWWFSIFEDHGIVLFEVWCKYSNIQRSEWRILEKTQVTQQPTHVLFSNYSTVFRRACEYQSRAVDELLVLIWYVFPYLAIESNSGEREKMMARQSKNRVSILECLD